MLTAVFISYRKPRDYEDKALHNVARSIVGEMTQEQQAPQIAKFTLSMAAFAILATIVVQPIQIQ